MTLRLRADPRLTQAQFSSRADLGLMWAEEVRSKHRA